MDWQRTHLAKDFNSRTRQLYLDCEKPHTCGIGAKRELGHVLKTLNT